MDSPDTKTYVVTLQSIKGGVGKTTCALLMAYEWLTVHGVDRPVVVLDLDIHGTEASDLLLTPYAASALTLPKWRVGMLDLLTCEAGTNRTFERLIEKELSFISSVVSWDQVENRIPMWKPDAAKSGVITIPSFREREPKAREREASRDNLSLRFTVDSFGRIQIKRRMKAVLHFLLKEAKPSLLLIDNSPFHLEIGNTVRELLGAWAEGKEDTPPDIECRHVTVLGRDLQEWPKALVDLQQEDSFRAKPTSSTVRVNRWIANKDNHEFIDGKETCRTYALLRGAVSPGPDKKWLDFRAAAELLRRDYVLHIPWNSRAAEGMFGYLSGVEPAEEMRRVQALSMFFSDVLSTSQASARRWDGSIFAPCTFREWLR